jgi:hypothetical protein
MPLRRRCPQNRRTGEQENRRTGEQLNWTEVKRIILKARMRGEEKGQRLSRAKAREEPRADNNDRYNVQYNAQYNAQYNNTVCMYVCKYVCMYRCMSVSATLILSGLLGLLPTQQQQKHQPASTSRIETRRDQPGWLMRWDGMAAGMAWDGPITRAAQCSGRRGQSVASWEGAKGTLLCSWMYSTYRHRYAELALSVSYYALLVDLVH